MDTNELLTLTLRVCGRPMGRAPWWTCGLPLSHDGACAKVSVAFFAPLSETP